MLKKLLCLFIGIGILFSFIQAEKEPLVILITNDDGIDSSGLLALVEEFTKLGKVLVVAPLENQSGTSHSMRRGRATFFEKKELVPGVEAYWVDNTPAVCVNWAILVPLEGRVPDLVVSGINKGPNFGAAFGSGTVGGAREGALAGAVAIAASLLYTGNDPDFKGAAAVVRDLAQKALSLGQHPILWNVNFPYGKIDGERTVVFVEATQKRFNMKYTDNTNPGGKRYFWFSHDWMSMRGLEHDSDLALLLKGRITVTPHHVFPTDRKALEDLQNLFGQKESTLREQKKGP